MRDGDNLRGKLRAPGSRWEGAAPWSYNAFRKRAIEALVLRLRAAHPSAVGRPPCNFPRPALVACDWHEVARNRDTDGIVSGGTKLVHDALVEAGWFDDDGPRFIVMGPPRFFYPGDVGHKGAGVEVWIGHVTPPSLTGPQHHAHATRAWLPGILPDFNEIRAMIEHGARRSQRRAAG